MTIIEGLIRTESDGSLSFGNYSLPKKSKVSDFEHNGDLYKVKTHKEVTKLERNDMFVYESVPGTTVTNFKDNDVINFEVEGFEDAQVTLELEAEQEYSIEINDKDIGTMKTNLGGKLTISVELDEDVKSKVVIKKV
ncbi:MAG: endosialidase [Lachnospiraceae bacterium]|nr:endosialidase [Lachnospiraceae bacterium]